MYRAITSFTTNEYEVRKKQLLADDFTNQDEIDEFLRIGYIEVYDGSLEITENGTYDVEDYQTAEVEVQSGNLTDEEYAEANEDVDDILEGTQLKTIYPPDWSEFGYDETPYDIIDGFNYSKEIQDNWDSTQTSLASKFVSNNDLKYMPLVNTSNVTNMQSMFASCQNLSKVALFDTSNVTNMQSMFGSCPKLLDIPLFDTGNVTNMQSMFSGCSKLKKIPQLDTSKVTNFFVTFQSCSSLVDIPVLDTGKVTLFVSTFSGCTSLSNDSLNNILEMCIGATSYTGTKTLSQIGLSSSQATICQGLSNYAAFIEAGWTTGY